MEHALSKPPFALYLGPSLWAPAPSVSSRH